MSRLEMFGVCAECRYNDETCSMCSKCVGYDLFVPKILYGGIIEDDPRTIIARKNVNKIDVLCQKRAEGVVGANMNWDEYFLNLAENVSLKSKDESSKIGAVIVGHDHEIRSTGYNGFPRGFNDDDPIKQIRPMKYKYFEHAERNAIYNAARFGVSVKDCTIYCPWPPCSDCARAIIQSRIKKLVVKKAIINCPDRWHEDMCIASDMLRECGVKFEVYDE